MRPLPIRKISALVDLFVEACTKQPHSEITVEVSGSYAIDKDGEFSLVAIGEGDLPTNVPIDAKIDIGFGKRTQAAGVGTFRMRLYRPDYTKNPSLHTTDDSSKGKG